MNFQLTGKEFKCTCGRKFTQKDDYEDHYQRRHLKKSSEDNSSQEQHSKHNLSEDYSANMNSNSIH